MTISKSTSSPRDANEKKRLKEREGLARLCRIYVLLILCVFPLAIGPEGYRNIVNVKAGFLWTVSSVFLLIFMLFWLVHRFGLGAPLDGKRWYERLRLPDWALIAFIGIATISCIASPYREMVFLGNKDRFDGWLTLMCMTLPYFAISRFYKPRTVDFMLFAASSVILCVLGMIQFYGINILEWYPPELGFSGAYSAYRTTLGNVDFLSAYLCMSVIGTGLMFVKTRGAKRFIFLAASLINFVMIFIGGADAGKMGLLAAVIMAIPFVMAKREELAAFLLLIAGWGLAYCTHFAVAERVLQVPLERLPLAPILAASTVALVAGLILLFIKKWPTERVCVIIGCAVIALIVVGGLAGVEIVGRRLPESNIIYQAREVLHFRMQDSFGSYRGYIWRTSMEAVPQHPLVGSGSDTYAQALGAYAKEQAIEAHGVYYDKAHNDFIQVLICYGALGLLAYLAFVGGVFVRGARGALRNPMLLAVLGMVVAYVGQSFFGVDTVVVTPVFWCVCAVIMMSWEI